MANTCNYYQYEGGLFSGGEYCLVSGNKERISSDYYNRYCCRDYNMRDCPLYKKYGPYIGTSACFITTITCKILNKEDDDTVLNKLRNFRNNILQNNSDYYDILKEYDSIGPVIAFKIQTDNNKKRIAESLYNNFLTKITNLIELEEYDKAVEQYHIMTLLLINYYGLKHDYNKEVDSGYHYQDFDAKQAGHGYKPKERKKLKTE